MELVFCLMVATEDCYFVLDEGLDPPVEKEYPLRWIIGPGKIFGWLVAVTCL